MLMGLCGGSGSGKSTIIDMLKEQFPGQISVIDMDHYYISRDELPFDERKLVNYDVPESLDWERIMKDIRKLKAGEGIEQPQFTFQTYERTKATLKTEPLALIIVDGIFSLYWEELRNLYDIRVFLDVPSDVRLLRRMTRNVKRYGRTEEFEKEQFYETVKPMHDRYVEPCKKYADIILPFEEKSADGLGQLIEIVRKLKELKG